VSSNSSSGSSSGQGDSQARADLKLVNESGRTRSAEETSPTPDAPRGTGTDAVDPSKRPANPKCRRVPAWLFIVVAAILILALIWQVRVAGELESQVAGLEDELAQVSVQLDAHRVRLFEIRGGVHDLSASLESLRALVDSDPGEDAPAAAVPSGEPSAAADLEPGGYPGDRAFGTTADATAR
jgi:hypothetical protein